MERKNKQRERIQTQVRATRAKPKQGHTQVIVSICVWNRNQNWNQAFWKK